MPHPNYGQVIRYARERGAIPQWELAKKIGVSRVSLSYWETNQTSPHRDKHESIAKALGLELDEFHRLAMLPKVTEDEFVKKLLRWYTTFGINAVRFRTTLAMSTLATTPESAASQAATRVHFGDSDPASPVMMTYIRVVDEATDEKWDFRVQVRTTATATFMPDKDDQP